jgi:hypothetical protein
MKHEDEAERASARSSMDVAAPPLLLLHPR